MYRIHLPSLIALGLAIVLFHLLLVGAAYAAAGVISCPSAPVGGALSTCTPGQECSASVTNDTMVRTIVGTAHQWQKWITVPATGPLRACDTASTADKGWTTKQASGILVMAAPPPPPPVVVMPAPPAQPEVRNHEALWWSPTTRDTEGKLIEATGYRVYQGTTPGAYPTTYTVTGTRLDLSQLAPGTYYFAVSSFVGSIESARSSEVKYTAAPPVVEIPKVLKCAPPVISGPQVTMSCAYE